MFENVSYITHGHNILNFAPQISSGMLLMLEEEYGIVVMTKTKVYMCHKCFQDDRACANGNLCMPLWNKFIVDKSIEEPAAQIAMNIFI
jgi:hypothetical protein